MRKMGFFVILLSGALWGTMGFFVRHLIALGLDQIQIIFMKMLIGMICISAFLLVKDRSLLKIRLKDWWIFAGCGIVSMLGSNFCYYKAMEYTTLAVAVVILYIAPAVAMLVSALIFKEKVTPAKLAALFIIFGGCVCAGGLFSGQQTVTMVGLLLAIGSGLFFGLNGIFSRFAVDHHYSPYTTALYNMFFCFLGTLPFMDFSGLIGAVSGQMMLHSCGLGILCAAIPYVIYTVGLRYIDPGEAAMLATSELIVASLISVIVFKEPFTMWLLIGTVLIIGGICLMNYSPKKSRNEML